MNDSSAELIQINQESLKTLIRGITYFQEEFSLILAVCNYRTLREQIVQQLREQCPVQMRELVLEKSVQTLYTRIAEELGAEQPNALMIVGLESLIEIDTVLTATNQIREEFRNFNFPLVLWVTDAILYKLIRLIPDFHSWATTVEFQMTVDELIQLIRQTVDEVFVKVLNSRDNVFLDNAALDIEKGSPRCAEIKSACEELQHRGVTLDPELEAGLEFILGRVADNSDVASREHYEQSLALWKQTGDLERSGILLFYIGDWWRYYAARHRVEHQQAGDRAREYFQQSIQAFEQANRPDLAAKFINFWAEVLHRLKHWRELELVAQKALVLHQTHYDQFRQARVYGFLAEVALSKSLWIEAKQAAEQALSLLDDATTKTRSNPSPEQSDLLDLERSFHQGWYLFSLAKAQWEIGQLSEAIATLETARYQTKPQYDPQLYIDILINLREYYFQQKQYLNAFDIKQERQAIESQFGFRAFIGAGRLQPKQQIANPALLSAESEDEVAQEIASSGRLHSVERLLERIERDDCKLTIIHGESGVGKSSIEQAGLIPALKQKPINARSVLPVLQQVYADWADELAKCLEKELVSIQKAFSLTIFSAEEREDNESDVGLDSATLSLTDSLLAQLRKNADRNLLTILIFDQFEEFFFICKDSVQRKKFYDFLRACLEIPYVKVILSLREDYLHYLLECTRFTRFDVIHDNILDKNIIFYLGNFKPDEAKLVIQSLTERTQFELEPALIDELVKDLAGEVNEVRPVELQIVGAQLQSENITTLAQYQKKGPKAALVARFLEEVIKDCGQENKQLAELVLWLLTDENSTRPLRTRDDLKKGLEDLLTEISHLELVLEIFVKSGLVLLLPSFPDNRYQLVHDYLADFVRRQKNNELIEELEKERAQRKRSEAELNRVLKRQLKLAMAGGAMMAVFAVLAGVFGVAAKIGETNAELKQISANSESLLASEKELEALVEGLKAGKKLKHGWRVEPNTKNQVVSRLQEVVYSVRERNRLEGHTDTIADISFSPDGKFIASSSKDKTVILWNRDGSDKKPALQGKYGNEFTSVAFSPDSQIIAAGNKDSKIYLWSLNGTFIKSLTGHRDWVTNIRFSPDGKRIVSASRDNSVRLWKIDDPQIKELKGHSSTVNIVRFSPDGQRIASASEDGTIKLWSLEGKQLQYINSPGVLDLAFSPDSKILSVASRDNTLKIWKIDGRILLATNNLADFFSPVFACFSSDGKLLAAFNKWNRGILWKIEGSKIEQLKDLSIATPIIGSISPDAKTIALASKDNVVKLVSLDSETFDNHEDGINKSNIIGLSPDNLPVSIDDNQLKFWNSDGTVKNSIELADRMENVSFSRDGKLIVLMGTQITTKLWNSTENLLNTFELNSSFPEVSPDGKFMVTVERNNTAKLWSSDGKLIGNLPGQKARITKVFFSPDSQLIATVSQDNIAKLWNQDGKWVATLQGHTKKIAEVIFSADSQLIATVSLDNTVKLWKRDGSLLKIIEKSRDRFNRGTSSDNSQVRFSPDSQMLFVSSNYNDVQLWDRNGKVIQTLKTLDGLVYNAIFSPNNQIIATTSSDRKVKLWRRDGTFIATLAGYFSTPDISFSRDSKLIVSVNFSVKLWGVDGKEIATLADNSDDSPKINFSPDSATIILIAKDNVKLYNREGRLIGTIKNDGDDVPPISVSQDGRLIASVGRNKVVNLSSSNGKLIQSLTGHHSKITLVTFSPDSKMLATADEDNKVKLWQRDGKLILNLQGHGNRVERVDFGADGKTFAVSGVEDVVQLWNSDSKKIVATLKGHRDRINSVSFSPTTQLVASASDDNTVRLWDFDGNALHILDKHTDKVNRVRFSQDGKILASASNDKSVNIWNSKGQFIKSLNKEHKSPVRDVIFNPNSSKIASASDDSTVILWDYQSGKLEHRLSGHSASVKSLSFSPNGEILASADDIGVVKIWSRDGIMLKSFQQDSFTGDNISFNSDGQQIFTWMRGKDNYYYRKPLLWSMNLNNLLEIGCQKARDYLNNNPNLQKNERSLCD